MTLAAARSTVQIDTTAIPSVYEFGAAVDIIYAGAMVCLNAAGYAEPAGASAGQSPVIGRAERTVDNSGGSAGDLNVRILPGQFKFDNSGTSIALTNTGAYCYAVDDESVALTDAGSSRPLAGIITRVDSDGVVVQTQFGIGAASEGGGQVQRSTLEIVVADLTTVGTSQTLTFPNAIEAGSRVLGVGIPLATPFTGGGAAACTVDVGDAGDTDALVDGAVLLAAAVDGEASAITLGIAPHKTFAAATSLQAVVTSDVNVSTLTAGACTLHVFYAVVA